ncbi:mariner Mos1 transposase [Trichonephila clavipes]|nr:mariner Mos1 transposase [Trichonephila clavipes]
MISETRHLFSLQFLTLVWEVDRQNGLGISSETDEAPFHLDAVQTDRKAESLGLQDTAVYFLGSEGTTYYELLKPGETVNTDCYKQQLLNLNDAMLEKRTQYKKRQHKVIFLDDNAPSQRAKPTKDIVKVSGWELL